MTSTPPDTKMSPEVLMPSGVDMAPPDHPIYRASGMFAAAVPQSPETSPEESERPTEGEPGAGKVDPRRLLSERRC